ncbi:Palmitoyltransferase [Podochytrium sp. JEL0797]|nr:Palmitoyltransferase [Podochytrium sp. JEL0797]
MKNLVYAYGPVALTVLLITLVPFTSQYFVLVPWLWFHPVLRWQRLLLLMPFNVGVLSIWTNYFLACRTQPGCPAASAPKGSTTSNAVRFCRKCDTEKPPRAHHCRECGMCVLKMDHHCPWLNNCVGFYNHGYFLRFTLSVGFSSSYCLFLYGLYLRHIIRSQSGSLYNYKDFDRFYTPTPTNSTLGVMIVNIVILLILLLTVGTLSLWQLYYISNNTTTIEVLENDKIDRLKRRGTVSNQAQYPFDLGSAIANLKTVLGPTILLWWLPLPQRGDGHVFPIHAALIQEAKQDGFDVSEWQSWPPQEYFDYKAGRIAVYQNDSTRNPRSRPSEKYIVESSADEDDSSDMDSSDNDSPVPPAASHSHNGTPTLVQLQQQQFQRRKIVRRGPEGYLVKESGSRRTPARPSGSSTEEEEDGSQSESDPEDDVPLVNLKPHRS